MTVDTWAELIAVHYQLAKDVIFSGSDLVEAVRRTQWLENLIQGGGLVKEDLTLYRNSYRPKGAKKPIHCFLAAGRNEKPTGENATKNWINMITTDLIEKRLTRSSILTVENEIKIENPGATGKRKMPQAQKTDTLDAKCLTSLEIDPCDHSRRKSLSSLTDVPLPQASLTFTYWESPEAQKLFVPRGDETVLERIEAQIAILRGANKMHLSYLDVIDNPLQDILDEDSLTSYQVWALQQRCLVLCVALKIAKEK